MSLIIKSDLVIENPILGKVFTKRILTSDTCVRDSVSSILNTQTLADIGGFPYLWTGAEVMEYTEKGISNQVNSTLGTVYLETDQIKNFDISFEITELNKGNVIFDLRRQKTNNRCVRFYLKEAGLQITNRHSVGDIEIQPNIPLLVGDKVNIRLVDSNVRVSINNKPVSNVTLTETAQTELDRLGYMALSKGDTTGVNNQKISFKNLVVSEVL